MLGLLHWFWLLHGLRFLFWGVNDRVIARRTVMDFRLRRETAAASSWGAI